MTQCKNNPKKSYKGTEPSPKGLGYCGSGEKEGTIKKGKDGKQWIIKNKRWIKYNSNKKNKDESYKTDDNIIKYYSSIGSNDVPYPVAIGEKYVYFLVEKTYVLKTLLKKNSKESEYINDYYEYIKKKDINKIKNVKITQKRLI